MAKPKRPDIDEDIDDVRRIAAWAESKAQLRATAASVAGNDGAGSSYLYTNIPTDIDQEMGFDAAANLAALEEYEKRLTDQELAIEAAEMNFYIRCNACHRPGIYFTRNPAYGGPIGRHEWYARYKPDAAQAHFNPIVCQVCLTTGVQDRGLAIEWNGRNTSARDASFNPAPRHTFKVPKDPAMAKFVKACRVWKITGEVNNMHIPEWEARLAQWRAMSDDEKLKLGWKGAVAEVVHAE